MKLVTWFLCGATFLGPVDPPQLSKHSGVLCSSRPCKVCWRGGGQPPVESDQVVPENEIVSGVSEAWYELSAQMDSQISKAPRLSRGSLPASVRPLTTLGVQPSERLLSPPTAVHSSFGPNHFLLPYICHCHVEKCDGA